MSRFPLCLLPCLLLASDAFAQTPAFGPAIALHAQRAPLAVTAADLNGDGAQDIVIANAESANLSVSFGTGTGAFSSPTTIALPAGCLAAFLTTGKFTGGSAPDILAVCPLGGFVLVPNTGHGNFGAPVSTALPGGAWVGNLLFGSIHPAIADLNGDGFLDVAMPTFDSTNLVGGWFMLLGKGNGSFQAPTPLPFYGSIPVSVAAGDFNSDGKADLITAGYDDSGILSLQFAAGKGDGTFQPPLFSGLPSTAGSTLLTADLNGDGKLDVVITGSSLVSSLENLGDDVGDSGVTVLLGNGKGGFSINFNVSEGSYMSGAALADMRGTGKLDLVETLIQGNFLAGAVPKGFVTVRPGNGDGTFGSPVTLSVSTSTIPTDVVAADFNGDGQADIAFSSIPAVGVSIDVSIVSDFSALLQTVLQQFPAGDGDILLNLAAPAVRTFTDANAASYATGSVARGSIVSAFGSALSVTPPVSNTSVTLPTSLGGDTITIKDSAGATVSAPLFYVSPTQINYAIPDSAALGAATITIQGASTFTATQQIVAVAPGIFLSGAMAAGSTVRLVNGALQTTPLIQNGALQPIDVTDGQTFLVLYGTGIHNHTTPVIAKVGSAQVTAAYAGAQGVYLGEDQINIQLPASLKGAGTITVTLVVDGQSSNAAQIAIQ